MNNYQDLIGDFIDKKCPKCGSSLLGNKVGDEWCSFIECAFGCEDFYEELNIDHPSDKSPVSHRHTLEGEVDATTELVSGKSSGLIGGMRQEKPMADERIDINQEKICKNCYFFEYAIENRGFCILEGSHEPVTTKFYCEEFLRADTRP